MKKTLLADSSLLFVAFIWGTTFVLVQNAIRVLEPMSFNATRFFLAGMILLLWLLLFYRPQLKQINKKMLAAGFLMGLWLFSGYALQTFGLLYTTSSKAGFITGLSVVLVPLFAFFLLKQRPKPNSILGVLVATAGLYMLTLGDSVSVNKGDILVFFCAIAFALHIIFTGKYTTLFPTLLLTVTQILTVAILCSIFAFIFEDWNAVFSKDVLLSNEVIIALLITSIFATALAFLLQTNFQKYTTPTRVALIFAMEPVFAALGGYYLADERLTVIAISGCLFIFVGMVFAELPGRKKKSLQPSEHISY
ncbi:DMT family transporter [Cytobacillus suaedae]|nr:DMT family transporter [Cytobacillus suaedae]